MRVIMQTIFLRRYLIYEKNITRDITASIIHVSCVIRQGSGAGMISKRSWRITPAFQWLDELYGLLHDIQSTSRYIILQPLTTETSTCKRK